MTPFDKEAFIAKIYDLKNDETLKINRMAIHSAITNAEMQAVREYKVEQSRLYRNRENQISEGSIHAKGEIAVIQQEVNMLKIDIQRALGNGESETAAQLMERQNDRVKEIQKVRGRWRQQLHDIYCLTSRKLEQLDDIYITIRRDIDETRDTLRNHVWRLTEGRIYIPAEQEEIGNG